MLGELVRPHPVKVTSHSSRHKVHDTPCEAEVPILYARCGRRVASSPQDVGELSHNFSLNVDVHSVGLAQSAHVDTGPELVPLVQVNVEAVSEVSVVIAVSVSYQDKREIKKNYNDVVIGCRISFNDDFDPLTTRPRWKECCPFRPERETCKDASKEVSECTRSTFSGWKV